MADGLARLVVGRDPARTLVRVVVLVAVAALVITYGILPVRGQGPSMQPTIGDGQLLIVSRLSYRLRAPRRGEVVAVRLASDDAVLVKRILAAPGDRIGIDEGQVVVNDVALDEPYVEFRMPWRMDEVTLGAGRYFVVGDNRGMPMTLHTMGTVAGERLIGPVVW
jgi:signal peptidase I